jgi:hypothetical protein
LRIVASRSRIKALSGRKVDAHQESRWGETQTLPSPRLGTGLGQDESIDVVNETNLLGEGDEGRRLKEPVRRVFPANECLESDDHSRNEIDDRLIMDAHLFGEDRAAQVGFELQSLNDRDVHLILVLLDTVLTLGLGEIHSEIGVSKELVAGVTFDAKCDAHAHRGREFLTGDDDRLAQNLHKSSDHLHDFFTIRRVFDEDGELVAAQPSRGIGFAKTGHERGGNGTE